MERYLLEQIPVANRTISVPQHAQMHGVLTNNLTELEHSLRFSARYLESDNVLVKLFNALSFSGEDAFAVWLKNRTIGDRTARSIGITTDATPGKELATSVLQHGCLEYLITRDDPFPMNTDWWDWEPIRIESHSYHDLTWDYLARDKTVIGSAVVSIDVAQLALMWYLYCTENPDPTTRRKPEEWLLHYPLVNTIRRYAEIAVYNRLLLTWSGERLEKPTGNLGWVTLLNPYNSFQQYQRKLKPRLRNANQYYGDYLKGLKLIEKTPWDLLSVHDTQIRTQANRWAYILADALVLDPLLNYVGDNDIRDYERWAQTYAKSLRMSKAIGAFRRRGDYIESRLNSHYELIEALSK